MQMMTTLHAGLIQYYLPYFINIYPHRNTIQ